MNRKQRRTARAQGVHQPIIEFQGKNYTLEEAISLAIQEQGLKHTQQAVEIYQRIIAEYPKHADAHNNYSIVLGDLGRDEEALVCGSKAIALNPEQAMFYYNRANTLQGMRRLDEALADYNKAITLGFNYPAIYNNRGIVLQELKRYDEALESFAKAIELKPDYAPPYYNRSVGLQVLGRYEEAMASFDRAIELKPDYAEAYNNRAAALRELRRFDEALASSDKAIVLFPHHPAFHYNRGVTLQEMFRYNDALASYDKAIQFAPNYAEAYNNRGAVLQELKRYEEALASCRKAIELNPANADAYNNSGVILLNEGHLKDAEVMFRKALEIRPDFAIPRFSLANSRKYKDPDDADAKAIRDLLERPAASQRQRDYLYFALGKIYDDCGRYDEAFEAYRQANAILSEKVSYHPGARSAVTNGITQVFSKEFLAQRFPFASDDATPVFIVGMPRSGTTLMASILSNHPSVGSAGELPTLTELSLCLPELNGNQVPYPQAVKHITPAVGQQLTEDYLKRLRRDFGPTMPFIIDKHPHNFRHLGFIAMLFPKAHIIHCTRHPLDIALSNYFQRFALDYDYSFDLNNLGHFYVEYNKMMQHWREALPLSMIEVSYEDMIAGTEQVARRALDLLGLEWDERCLSPHTNRYAIETASRWQVRQPIYKQSLERWRHYEKQLAPLKEILTRNGIAL